MFMKTIDLADNERGILFKRNRFAKILPPGRHRFFDPARDLRVEIFDVSRRDFEHRLGKYLLASCAERTAPFLVSYELRDNEVGLCYVDGILSDILPPASFRMYWKGPEEISVRVIDITNDFRVPEELLAVIGRGNNPALNKRAAEAVYYTDVEDNGVGMLLVNGKLDAMLQPGSYGFWRYNRNITVKHLDTRLQTMDVGGQEILTKDRVSLRVNLSASYRISDPVKTATELSDCKDFLYRELQLQLRQAVGTKTLDVLLADKNALNGDIARAVRDTVADYGISVKAVGVKDLILPGEMKAILNKVVEAEKAAEANLIKRREETAATRSLHNTAKVMENNPTLMRLKELEVLEKVTERIDRITVFGGLEGVLKELVTIPGKVPP